MDTKKTIFQSAKSFLSGTLISRVTGLLRDIALAYAFGTNTQIAALMVAFRFSNFFRRLLGEGAMQSAFIPHFESLKAGNVNAAFHFFLQLKALLSIILIFLIGLVVALLTIFCSDSPQTTLFSSETREIMFLTALLMPSLFFICLYGLNSSLLQCERHYFIPSIAPIAFNCIWIIGIFSVSSLPPSQSIPYLAFCIVLASMGQWLTTLPKTYSLLLIHTKNRPFENFTLFTNLKNLKSFLSPVFLGILGVASTQINSTLDPLFALYADASGPAYLWFAIRLEQLPLSLFGIALSSALLPPLSRAIQNGRMDQYKFFLESSLQKTCMFMIPVTFAYFIAGDSCINLLFGRGDFDVDSITMTTQCLWAYSVGLIPSCLTLIVAPGFYALKNYRSPMQVTILSVILNMILNTFFVFILNIGSVSVALATALSAWFNCAALLCILSKQIGSLSFKKTIRICLFATAISTLSVLLVILVQRLLSLPINAMEIFYGKDRPTFPLTFAAKLLLFAVQAAAFALPVVPYWLYECDLLPKNLLFNSLEKIYSMTILSRIKKAKRSLGL